MRAGDPPPAPPSPPTPPAPPAAPAVAKPKIAFDRETHDFGVVRQEAEFHTEFALRNDGKVALHVNDVRADCGCSTATLATREIAPGATVPLVITFRTFTMAGPLTKRIRVSSDDPERPVVELHLKVDIAAGIVLDPARFYFGNVLVGTAPSTSVTLKWRDGVGKAFRLTGVDAPGADLSFETKPFEAPPWHGFTVTATFKKPPAIGTVSATALLRTDDPESPRFASSITAFVSGKVWIDQRAVSVGMVPYGKGRVLMLRARGLFADTNLGDVKATSKTGRVTLRVVPGGTVPGPGGGEKEWLVEVTLPESASPGRVDDVVLVSGAIPNEPPAEVVVTGQVLEKPR